MFGISEHNVAGASIWVSRTQHESTMLVSEEVSKSLWHENESACVKMSQSQAARVITHRAVCSGGQEEVVLLVLVSLPHL